MPRDNTDWWKRRVQEELETHGPTGLRELTDKPGLPERLIEAISELEAAGEIEVREGETDRIIHPTDDNGTER